MASAVDFQSVRQPGAFSFAPSLASAPGGYSDYEHSNASLTGTSWVAPPSKEALNNAMVNNLSTLSLDAHHNNELVGSPHIGTPHRSGAGSGSNSSSRKASHAKLHKRAGSKTSLKHRQSEHSDRSLNTFSRTNTPPVSTSAAAAVPSDSSGRTSSGKPRAKIKTNIMRFAARDEEDLTDVVDLSRSAAENEERSGLGISSPTVKTAMDGDFTRNVRHGRSTSQTSAASIGFRPSAPYVHPVHQSNPPSKAPSLIDSCNSFTSSSYSSRMLGGADSRTRTRTTSSASAPRRPDLRINTSTSSGKLPTLSTSFEQGAGSPAFAVSRKRRDTVQSSEVSTTPLSRTSFDKAFSIRRGATEPMDNATRSATIQAARQAFADREEAKARKYAEQERKAQEKERRKEERREERRRQKSESSVGAEASSASNKARLRKESIMSSSSRELPSVYTRAPSEAGSRRGRAALWERMKAKVLHKA